jgi:hypothetical protein
VVFGPAMRAEHEDDTGGLRRRLIGRSGYIKQRWAVCSRWARWGKAEGAVSRRTPGRWREARRWHQGDAGVLEEVSGGLKVGRRRLSMARCLWKKEVDD